MRKQVILCSALLLLWNMAAAQDAAAPKPAPVKGSAETMVVLGSATPVPLGESPRSVEVLPVKGQSLAAESPQDILREDSSVFLEERGAGGGQADVVLRGGSFEQTLVLLDGFRINDAQTSHHNLDLPVPLEAMDSIQVLAGAGSTLHGVDALSGVVDFLTTAPDHDSLFVRAGGGSFESNEETLMSGATRGRWSGRVTAERNFSTGFMADRDYRNEDASAENWIGSRLGVTDLLFATSDRAFGANQFYGNYPSWERTKGWFGGVRQELGSRTEAAFAYRRHTDDFVLFRDDPALYENNHIDGSWQGMLRRTENLPAGSVLLMGLEADGDSINSYNFSNLNPTDTVLRTAALGVHARNRGAGYVDLDLRPAKRRWSLSAGAREEVFSGGAQAVFSPELAGSFRVANGLKLRASAGYGFRIPTYTDLYYSDPATLGNAKLKPESAWSGDAGVDWAPSSKLTVSATGFYSRQHDTIDYVKSATVPNEYLPAGCPANTWCADNLNGLSFVGVESTVTWIPKVSQMVRIAWTGMHGAQNALHGLESEYVFNYPVENIHAEWRWGLGHSFAIDNAVEIAQRYQQTVYPVWNLEATHATGHIQPYVRLTNLSNTGYQEISGVNMPSRTIVGGIALALGRTR